MWERFRYEQRVREVLFFRTLTQKKSRAGGAAVMSLAFENGCQCSLERSAFDISRNFPAHLSVERDDAKPVSERT